jgi:uncharacterized membrane protein YphA (DoxX/SURF4 family)
MVGITLILQGLAYLFDRHHLRFEPWMAGALALVGGAFLLAGFLTPVAGILTALASIAIALSLIPVPAQNLFSDKLATIEVAAIAMAIAFLGPGAYSLDARLFGRREISIPNTSRTLG